MTRIAASLATLGFTLSCSSLAFAKDAAPPLPTPAAPAIPATSATPATPAPVEATLGAYRCTLPEHEGVTDGEARIVSRLMCEELQTQHAAVGEYAMTLERLDGELLFGVSGPSGARRVTLARVSEVRTAIPRMIQALLEQKSVQATENVENVLTQEGPTRKAKKKGTFGVNLGVFGVSPVGQSVGTGAGGALVGIGYETGRLGVVGDMRYAGGSSGRAETNYFALTGGARYFFSEADIAPFAGAGLAVLVLGSRTQESYSKASNTGLAAYAEGGVEFLRTHTVTFNASVRADAPVFNQRSSETKYETSYDANGNPRSNNSTTHHDSYQVPISATVAMFLHW